ncbi:uncharacterized protein F5147DRAFT_776609 [Suillus discolor]|uniref:Uncharacterized protein n=1 Tax=Suillus discolor TaxID=1912936 RepID=A0A9P7JRM6_9AGAM|nr:uncharacterized protein F5147DRAFT_776609 [Suillus discolor]KAG2101606.1 hypothetical protein F5147DRAFT_776609 [Suillus discolor]
MLWGVHGVGYASSVGLTMHCGHMRSDLQFFTFGFGRWVWFALLDVSLPARLVHLLSLILLLAFFPPPALIRRPYSSEPRQQLLMCTGRLRMAFAMLGMVWWSYSITLWGVRSAAAQARPGQGQAIVEGFGPACDFWEPKPSEARPKPGLSSQAGPEHH